MILDAAMQATITRASQCSTDCARTAAVVILKPVIPRYIEFQELAGHLALLHIDTFIHNYLKVQ